MAIVLITAPRGGGAGALPWRLPIKIHEGDLAEHNRLHARNAFEEAKRISNDQWLPHFYWALDALGVSGYGVPGQGRVLRKFDAHVQVNFQVTTDIGRER